MVVDVICDGHRTHSTVCLYGVEGGGGEEGSLITVCN